MSVTNLKDVINPEVMGDMIDAKIEALAKITSYAKIDTTLEGVPGDTKTVPSWNYIGDAEDIAEGEEVGLTELSASTTQFTIKKAMKSVGITEEARLSGYGDPVGQAESQLAKAIIGKTDTDILKAALTSRNVFNGTSGVIGYKSIIGAIGTFEDEEDDVEKVMFIHPEQETQLLLDDNFLSADKFTGGVAVNGSIGKIGGCWIKKSKKVPKKDAVTAVQGVYTITIAGTVTDTDKITIDGEEFELTASDNTAAKAVASLKAKTFQNYTATGSGDVLTLTEKTGKEGHGKPTVSTTGAETFTVATTTAGVAACVACFECPLIKCEPDSSETEYTEAELPALTRFIKKNVQVDHDWKSRTQTHEITAAIYYGAALTNEAKVVIAKFAQETASN